VQRHWAEPTAVAGSGYSYQASLIGDVYPGGIVAGRAAAYLEKGQTVFYRDRACNLGYASRGIKVINPPSPMAARARSEV
jgi:hypothetical protein